MDTQERKIDVRLALRAYEKVVAHGAREGDVHRLDGLTASSDFDGYTVMLSDGVVTVRLLFHNQVSIEAHSGKALENFVQRIQRVADGDFPDGPGAAS
ncbi:MAG: DUF3081 family protein [Pseudomonadales bacterium]